MSDTVFALATAPGRAAVAMVRLSGPESFAAVRALAGRLPPPRRASLRALRGLRGERLDTALVLWMPGPASYTGEDTAELHLHGGPAVTEGVLLALRDLGLRLAEPGEFTRRAFANGRMDLLEAEAVADLVDAEGAAQRRQALDQLDGRLGARHHAWRDVLLDALAHLEAAVDFPDEDLPYDVAARARPPLAKLKAELEAAAADPRGERVREGLRVALVGAPNAGKSTLLNALLGREAAIVAPLPGTTRDVVEGRLFLAGVSTVLADTAEPVEAEGVRRARAWAARAHLRVWVRDMSVVSPSDETTDLITPGDLVVGNKADLAQPTDVSADLAISALDPSGVAQVRERLEAWATSMVSGGEPPAATRLRHRLALTDAATALERAIGSEVATPELMAEDVRLAARALERLSGRLDPEEVLGRIFSAFCVGK